jgi:hypothetical protein
MVAQLGDVSGWLRLQRADSDIPTVNDLMA